MSNTRRQHFTSIDALRGFAALSVALFHLGGAGLPKLSSPLTTRLTSWGWTGVEVFFVISGFVIPFVMVKADHQWRDSLGFLARRFLRIWPPSSLLVLLTVARFWFINTMVHGGQGGWTALSVGNVVANLFYVSPFVGQPWLNGVFWTLSVEWQYYLFLVLAFPLLVSNRPWLIAAGVACLLTPLLPFADQALFFKYAVYFAMGGLTLIYRENRIGKPGFVGVLAIMSAVSMVELGGLQASFATATALAIAFIPIRNRLFVFLGTISYSLYLVHMLVASTTEFILVRVFAHASLIEKFALQLVCLAIAIVGAWVYYLLVERHCIRLSQRFAGHLRGRRRAVVTEAIPAEGM